MGDGTKFDFDSLRWWRFIDRNLNAHAHANPDALSNADPVRNAISYPFCDTFAVGNAFCDTNTDASSGPNAHSCRMSFWGLQICRCQHDQ